MAMRQTDELSRLEDRLHYIRQAPADGGTVELIARRPAEDEREVVGEARLDLDDGLVGDTWRSRGSRHTPDGGPDGEAQVTLMNARAAAAIAGDRERWALAGDQLYVDLDLSVTNLPPGSRIQIGSAVIEFSEKPHTGCAKFQARFGNDALRFVNSPAGRELRLRGANCRVVMPGTVRPGDAIRKVPNPAP
jgi:MOSC domain-containing protein YiiM